MKKIILAGGLVLSLIAGDAFAVNSGGHESMHDGAGSGLIDSADHGSINQAQMDRISSDHSSIDEKFEQRYHLTGNSPSVQGSHDHSAHGGHQ